MMPAVFPAPISSKDLAFGNSARMKRASTPAVKARYQGINRRPHFNGSFLSNTTNLRVRKSVAAKPAARSGAIAQEVAICERLPPDQAHFRGVYTAIPAPEGAPTTV